MQSSHRRRQRRRVRSPRHSARWAAWNRPSSACEQWGIRADADPREDSGAATVSAGQKVVLIISGYTRRPYTLLAFFYDNRSCARTGLAEEARRESREFLLHRSGSFRITWTIKSSKPGVHYDCAYLMRNGRPHDTKARAGAHYLTS